MVYLLIIAFCAPFSLNSMVAATIPEIDELFEAADGAKILYSLADIRTSEQDIAAMGCLVDSLDIPENISNVYPGNILLRVALSYKELGETYHRHECHLEAIFHYNLFLKMSLMQILKSATYDKRATVFCFLGVNYRKVGAYEEAENASWLAFRSQFSSNLEKIIALATICDCQLQKGEFDKLSKSYETILEKCSGLTSDQSKLIEETIEPQMQHYRHILYIQRKWGI